MTASIVFYVHPNNCLDIKRLFETIKFNFLKKRIEYTTRVYYYEILILPTNDLNYTIDYHDIYDQYEMVSISNLFDLDLMIMNMEPIKQNDIISFLDNHLINYDVNDNKIRIENIIPEYGQTYHYITLTIYSHHVNICINHIEYHCIVDVYKTVAFSFNDLIDILTHEISMLPGFIKLKSILTDLESEYMNLLGKYMINPIEYPTKILTDQIKYADEFIDELYAPNGDLSLYYEQLFYAIVD